MFMVNQLAGFGAGGDAGFRPLAVHFDGDDAWLESNGDHGGSDNQYMLWSVWVRHYSSNRSEAWYWGGANLTYCNKFNDGSEFIQVIGAGGMNIATDVAMTSQTWTHILFSVDRSTQTAHFYINDTEAMEASPTVGTSNINWTPGSWDVGSTTTGTLEFGGDMMELYLTNEYLDISQEANRRKFISDGGLLVDLGDDGSLPTGTQPLVYLSRRTDEAATAFMTNRGSGATYSYSGANALLDGQEIEPWNTGYKELLGTWDDPFIYQTGRAIDSTNGHGGFKFTPTQSGTIAEVRIEVTSKGTAGHTSTLEIWTDSSGSPGALVTNGASQAFAVDRLGVHKVTWATPPSVTGSTTYWLIIKHTSSLFRVATVDNTGPGDSSGRNTNIAGITVQASQPSTNENWRVQITVT